MAVRIIAGGIYQLCDARYLNALEADIYLSFSFDAIDPASVTVEQAKEILNWLHEPAVVAAFGLHQDKQEVLYVLGQLGAKAILVPENHVLAAASDAWITFIEHPVKNPDDIPALQHDDRLFHILNLNAGNISLDELCNHTDYTDWKKLIQNDHIFIRVPLSDYTSTLQQEWQPGGWDIRVPSAESGTDLPDIYGDFLEAL